MLEIENKMIMLLKKGVTFSKLKSKTGLCSSELVKKMNNLRNKGYVINKHFNDDCVRFVLGDKTVFEMDVGRAIFSFCFLSKRFNFKIKNINKQLK